MMTNISTDFRVYLARSYSPSGPSTHFQKSFDVHTQVYARLYLFGNCAAFVGLLFGSMFDRRVISACLELLSTCDTRTHGVLLINPWSSRLWQSAPAV